MNQPYARVNQPYATLRLASVPREMFGVQLYKNNARAQLLRILSILNLDWLQHACSVGGVYEIIIICSFCNLWLPTHWVLKGLVCASGSCTHSWSNLRQSSRLVHIKRHQKLWIRNMKGFQFLGVKGNRHAWKKPTRAGMELANKIHIQPLASCIGKGKCPSTKPTRLTTGVVCHG